MAPSKRKTVVDPRGYAVVTEPLRKYQSDGVEFISEHILSGGRGVMLCDEMGLGKTRQAIEAAIKSGVERILIICPAGVRRVWQHEISRWAPAWYGRIVLIEPGLQKKTLHWAHQFRMARQAGMPMIVIVSYDLLSDRKSAIVPLLHAVDGRARWQLLICDEAHFLKNKSNRTQAIYGRPGRLPGVVDSADFVLLLTGTPAPNHAGELFQHIRTLWPGRLPGNGSEVVFQEIYTRYVDTQWGRQFQGSRNMNHLREVLAPVVLRRRKREVLQELPDLILQDCELATPAGPHPAFPSELERRLAAAIGTDDDAILAILNDPSLHLATARRLLGLWKAPSVVAWVEERLQSVDKIVLFAWHLDVISALAEGLGNFGRVIVTGGVPPAARATAVDRFQRDPSIRVFIGQINAAGVGITLTAANEVVLAECSWVPGENAQGIARAHRIGQKDCVIASFLYVADSLDEVVMRVFRRKAREIGILQGDIPDA